MALTAPQLAVLALVKEDRVRYVPIPVNKKEKPYYLVDRNRSNQTATLNRLKKQGFIRPAYPTIRSTEMVLTRKGEKVI